MPEPHLRAADADRAAVAEQLGDHMAAGRLTVAEYDERLTRAYAARTYGELAELTTDLPAVPVAMPAGTPAGRASQGASRAEPAPVATRWAGLCGGAGRAALNHGWGPGWGSWPGGAPLRVVWGSWLSTALVVLTIWAATSLATGSWIYPWPIWVIGPWGAVLLAQTLTGRAGPQNGGPGD